MTLIKKNSLLADRATGLRPGLFPAAPQDGRATQVDVAVREDPRDVKIANLASHIADLETALDEARRELERARSEEFARGHAEGLEAAEALDRERLDALSSNLEAAVATLGDHIDRDRDVAIDIARAALDRLFADPSLYAGMVVETARRQASALARGTVVALRVSAEDFPNPEALALLSSLGANGRVEADPSLSRGSCIFDLTLGALDASIDRQAAVIEGLFVQAGRRAVSA